MASLPTGTFLNAEAIYKGLIAMGLSPNAAAGVAGNIYQESHGDPTAYSPAGGGLFGLTNANGGTPHGGTLTYELGKLLAYIKANGSIANINANSPDPSSSALFFSNKYERPNAYYANNAVREAAAVWIAAAAKAGNWAMGSPATKTPPKAHTSTKTTPAPAPKLPPQIKVKSPSNTDSIPPSTPATPAPNYSPVPAQVGSNTAATPPSAATPSTNPATTTSFPGGQWDPLNWANDIGNAIGNALNPGKVLGNLFDPTKWLGDLFGTATAKDMMKRFGLIILGGLLIIVGVWILGGKEVVQTAVKAVK